MSLRLSQFGTVAETWFSWADYVLPLGFEGLNHLIHLLK